MMTKPPGQKELDVRRLRLLRAAGARRDAIDVKVARKRLAEPLVSGDALQSRLNALTEAPASKPINAPVVASALLQETTMKTKSKAKTIKAKTPKRSVSEAAANLRAAKKTGKNKGGAKRAAASARTPVEGETKAVRPGSKLEIVVGLLTRPEGCTTAEVLEATKWPSVSMPQMAKSAGLTLSKEKDGSVSRYRGVAAPAS